jgi:cytochrome c-type biogenesis protein CcmE
MPKKRKNKKEEIKNKNEDEKSNKSTRSKAVNDEKDKSDSKKDKGMSRTNKKIITVLVAIIIIVIVIIAGFWGVHGGEDYATVSDITGNQSDHLNKEVEVKGTVKQESLDMINKTFIITDEKNDLMVNYTDILPSNFAEGKDVVVVGKLSDRSGLVVDVEEIIVGCPSKY